MLPFDGPLSGDTPTTLDPQYHGYILITVIALCLPLLTFFVILRIYVRIWVPRSFSLDDGKTQCFTQLKSFTY